MSLLRASQRRGSKGSVCVQQTFSAGKTKDGSVDLKQADSFVLGNLALFAYGQPVRVFNNNTLNLGNALHLVSLIGFERKPEQSAEGESYDDAHRYSRTDVPLIWKQHLGILS